ncbi:MAG: hmc operon protein 4 [candidate division Zixibacteria bacterium]|nr:hmc operon protein 4 [candidate division Zixibacteria bacterium]
MTESIQTLQEFMTHTKGIAYLAAMGYLIGFAWFWKFLHKRERD